MYASVVTAGIENRVKGVTEKIFGETNFSKNFKLMKTTNQQIQELNEMTKQETWRKLDCFLKTSYSNSQNQ